MGAQYRLQHFHIMLMMTMKYWNSRTFKDLYVNSKTFKALFCFQWLSRSWKHWILSSRTFTVVWPQWITCCKTQTTAARCDMNNIPATEKQEKRQNVNCYISHTIQWQMRGLGCRPLPSILYTTIVYNVDVTARRQSNNLSRWSLILDHPTLTHSITL